MENSSNTPKPAPPKSFRPNKPSTPKKTRKPPVKAATDRSPHLMDRPFLHNPEMQKLQQAMNSIVLKGQK